MARPWATPTVSGSPSQAIPGYTPVFRRRSQPRPRYLQDMQRRSRPSEPEVQRFRTLVLVAVVYVAALPLATLWNLVNDLGVGPKQILFIGMAILSDGLALVAARIAGARAGFATAVCGGYAVVTFGMYYDAGTAGVTWAAFIGLVALVALSPASRWTIAAAAAGGAGVAAVCVSLRRAGADPAFSDAFKAAAIVCLLFAFGVLARDVAVAMWARGRTADAARARLEAAIEHAAAAQAWLSASLRDLIGQMEDAARTPSEVAAQRRIIAASDTATGVVDEMLEASRVRSGVAELQFERVDPGLVVGAAGARVRATVMADPVYLVKALAAAAGPRAAWTVTSTAEEVVLAAPTLEPPAPVAREVAEGIVAAHGGLVVWVPGAVEVHLPTAGAAGSCVVEGGDSGPWQEAWGRALHRAVVSAAPWVGGALVFTALGIVVGGAPGSLVGLLACAALWPLAFAVPRFTDLRVGYVIAILIHTGVVAGLVASSGGLAGALWVLIVVPAGMTVVLERWKMFVLGAAATLAMAAAVVPTMSPAQLPVVEVPLVLPLFAVFMLVPASRGFDRIAAGIEAANVELAARRREAMTFLTVIAHELRTPLTSVRGSAESLLMGGWEDAVAAEFVDTIRHETARLASLLDDLDAGVGRRLEQTPVVARTVPLGDVVATAVTGAGVAAAAGGHTVTGEVAAELAVVADPALLREVLDNLLSNAIRYSPPGTAVSVAAVADAGTGQVRVEVVDHGPGVRLEDRGFVFDRYWRATGAPGHGTGLGLAIARALVEAHGDGCRIWVEDTPGGGATFVFTLPMASRGSAALAVSTTPRT